MAKQTKFQRSLKAHERLRTSYCNNFEKHCGINDLKGFIYHAEVVLQMNYKGRTLTKQEKKKIYKDSYR